jgi:hypothetical protein
MNDPASPRLLHFSRLRVGALSTVRLAETPSTPALPRKRERERSADVAAIRFKFIML